MNIYSLEASKVVAARRPFPDDLIANMEEAFSVRSTLFQDDRLVQVVVTVLVDGSMVRSETIPASTWEGICRNATCILAA